MGNSSGPFKPSDKFKEFNSLSTTQQNALRERE
jgi:hypothetical protein